MIEEEEGEAEREEEEEGSERAEEGNCASTPGKWGEEHPAVVDETECSDAREEAAESVGSGRVGGGITGRVRAEEEKEEDDEDADRSL